MRIAVRLAAMAGVLSGTLGATGCGAGAPAAARLPTPGSWATATPLPTVAVAPMTPGGDVVATPTPVSSPSPAPTVAPQVTPGPPAVVVPVGPGIPAAAGSALRPDPGLTPGALFGDVGPDQVCAPGYARRVRHVSSEQYVAVFAEYGVPYPQPKGAYELDHLIPLELGGDNEDANLWPEPATPAPGFHEKDRLENRLHELVCSGQLDLRTAQHDIAVDWYAAYLRYVQPG